jgi:hypothetical protein
VQSLLVGTLASGGDIDVTVSGAAGSIALETPGDILFTLQDGATVTGDIVASAGGTATIKLDFSFNSASEKAAALASLVDSAASGSIQVAGKIYTWQGFTDLAKALTVIAQQNPGAQMNVTIDGSSSSPGDPFDPPVAGGYSNSGRGFSGGLFRDLQRAFNPTRPTASNVAVKPTVVGKLRCDDRAVTVFRMSDGTLSISVRIEDGNAYAVGQIVGERFERASGSRWEAVLSDGMVKVSERRGDVIATCSA